MSGEYLYYPATFTLSDGVYVVTFRDVPEAITQGETVDIAVRNAQYALIDAFSFYVEQNKPIPQPSKSNDGEQYVCIQRSAL